ncbi:MAG: hypothetical protein ACMUIP_08540 [bacterium]
MFGGIKNQIKKEIEVEMIKQDGNSEKKRFLCTSEENAQVNAGLLKQNFLNLFDEGSVLLEPEEISNENRSYHLFGFDDSGGGIAFKDDDSVDLVRYTHFEISPRRTGGEGKLLS